MYKTKLIIWQLNETISIYLKIPIISFSLKIRQKKANVLTFNLNKIFVIEYLLHKL